MVRPEYPVSVLEAELEDLGPYCPELLRQEIRDDPALRKRILEAQKCYLNLYVKSFKVMMDAASLVLDYAYDHGGGRKTKPKSGPWFSTDAGGSRLYITPEDVPDLFLLRNECLSVPARFIHLLRNMVKESLRSREKGDKR